MGNVRWVAAGILCGVVSLGCPLWAGSQDVGPSKGVQAGWPTGTVGESQDATADLRPATGRPNDRVRIGLLGWFSRGEGEWRIGFSGVDSTLGSYDGRSRLAWDGIDSTVLVLTGEVRVTPWLRLGGTYGSGDIRGGRGTDSDWLDVPALGIYNFNVSESQSDSDGKTTLYDLNAYVRLTYLIKRVPGSEFKVSSLDPESGTPNSKPVLDLFLGYQSYQDALRLRNGVQTVIDGAPVNIPFSRLDSTYDFDWSAFRVGVRGEVPLRHNVVVSGSAAYLFGISYRGEAFWNLRTDYRGTPPNFVHDAASGSGSEIKISLAYLPRPYLSVQVGYWRIALNANRGTDTVYLSNGGILISSLDDVKSIRSGAYVGVEGRF